MSTPVFARIAFFSVTASVLLGGGCMGFGDVEAPAVDSAKFQQPAPPAQPKKAPEIPAEAQKVPKPY